MAAIPRAQSAVVDRAGLPTREWYTYWLQLAQDAGLTEGQQKQLAELAARVAALEAAGGGSSLSIIGVGSVLTLGAQIVQITLDGDNDAPGTTYFYGTGPDGTKGWYKLADSFSADAGELAKSVDPDTGKIAFGLADLPDSGIGTALVKITRDQFGRVAGTESANTDDLPEGAANLYFTPDRVYEATKDQLVAGDNITIEPDDATKTITISASGGFVPYYIPDNTTFVVPLYQQALFTLPIELGVGSSIDLDGALEEVS